MHNKQLLIIIKLILSGFFGWLEKYNCCHISDAEGNDATLKIKIVMTHIQGGRDTVGTHREAK
jgi:hypothetical protein